MFGCHCTRKLLMILEQLRSVFSSIKSTARNILSATTIIATHLTFVVLATKNLSSQMLMIRVKVALPHPC